MMHLKAYQYWITKSKNGAIDDEQSKDMFEELWNNLVPCRDCLGPTPKLARRDAVKKADMVTLRDAQILSRGYKVSEKEKRNATQVDLDKMDARLARGAGKLGANAMRSRLDSAQGMVAGAAASSVGGDFGAFAKAGEVGADSRTFATCCPTRRTASKPTATMTGSRAALPTMRRRISEPRDLASPVLAGRGVDKTMCGLTRMLWWVAQSRHTRYGTKPQSSIKLGKEADEVRDSIEEGVRDKVALELQLLTSRLHCQVGRMAGCQKGWHRPPAGRRRV